MQQVLAACGAAAVIAHHDTGPTLTRWTIANDAIGKTLAWHDEGGLTLAELANRASGHIWQPDLATGPLAGGEFSMLWNDTPYSARQATTLHSVRAESDGAAVTVHFDLRMADALDVTLSYRLHAATAVIEQRLEITPLQAGTLSRVAPVTLSLAAFPTPVLHWARGLQSHGHYTPATGPYPAYRIRHQPLDGAQPPISLESGLRSTWHEIAWFALDSTDYSSTSAQAPDADEGLFTGLLYSGRWSADASVANTSSPAHPPATTLCVTSEGYATPLAAGTRWQSPAAFTGVYRGGLDDAAHAQHTYLRTAVIPPTAADFPWVQYNTWFAHLIDIDVHILRPEVDLAARLGAEVFVIDAGWWEPSRRTSDNFTTGLGRWEQSAEKFPGGVRAFADYVRRLGMRFGIWVEPERVDLRAPGTWHDRWLVRHNDAIVSPPWPPDTVSGWLCFGHPDVQAWAIDWISQLVEDTGAEWLKWDSNWWGVCTCTNHGHSATDGEFYQAQGVHAVLAELRRRFPGLMIENCAGGGTRTDFAMLGNSHVTWLHDSSTPSRRVRFHLAGANYLFPPEMCNTFIVDAGDELLTAPATPAADIDAIARSRMLGAFGISAQLPQWTDTALNSVQAAVTQYKEIRPILKRGRFYHLLPQTDLQCPGLPLHDEWEAYAVIDTTAPGSLKGAIWAFRAPEAVPTAVLRLRGLQPERSYELVDVDTNQSRTATGAEWLANGLPVDLAVRPSALVLIRG
jgi:alpha-galactosidase